MAPSTMHKFGLLPTGTTVEDNASAVECKVRVCNFELYSWTRGVKTIEGIATVTPELRMWRWS